MKKQPLRIGFDLDGVLLYNPVRIIRPFIALFKDVFLRKNSLAFYYPTSPLAQRMWKLFHKSSIYIAPGINDIKELVQKNKIKAYIITARYSFLGPSLITWAKKNGFDVIFSQIYFNKDDEQPHLFKENKIKELNLDFFIEDNWDIVNHLSHSHKLGCRIFWIYNIFDRQITYPYKYPYLAKVMAHIKSMLINS